MVKLAEFAAKRKGALDDVRSRPLLDHPGTLLNINGSINPGGYKRALDKIGDMSLPIHLISESVQQKKKRMRMQPNGTAPVRLAPQVGSGLAVRPRAEGLEIMQVFSGTSAESAGLLAGDLIVAIDGTPVHERGCRDPGADPAGRREVVSYLRDGVRSEVEIETELLVP